MGIDSGTLDASADLATEEKQDEIIALLTPVSRTPVTFEDTSFVSGDSPAILDVNTALGENGREFIVINDGIGDFTVSISNDGAVFGNEHTMTNGETYGLDDLSVDSIRITHVADSAYRAVAI